MTEGDIKKVEIPPKGEDVAQARLLFSSHIAKHFLNMLFIVSPDRDGVGSENKAIGFQSCDFIDGHNKRAMHAKEAVAREELLIVRDRLPGDGFGLLAHCKF